MFDDKLVDVFELINKTEKNIVTFSTMAKFVSECKVLYIDGILKSFTKIFKQLTIIHDDKNIVYTHLVFFFTNRLDYINIIKMRFIVY